jgi:hypothetical protein
MEVDEANIGHEDELLREDDEIDDIDDRASDTADLSLERMVSIDIQVCAALAMAEWNESV